MIKLNNQYISVRKKPLNLEIKDSAIFTSDYFKVISSTNLIVLNNIYILKDIIFSPQKIKFYSDYVLINKLNFKNKSYIKRLFLLLTPGIKVNKAIWILEAKLSHQYFHWVLDSIPRLILSLDHVNAHKVLLPERLKKYRFIEEYLELLGVSFMYYNEFRKVKVKELLLPSFISDISGNYNKEVLNKMRKYFIKEDTPSAKRKLFFSRKNAKRRNIINEEDVFRVLKSYGYEFHCPDDYSVAKQIELASQCKCLISAHGASLTNMIFMQDGGVIFELRDCYWNINCYYTLASELNFDYYYQINKGTDKSDFNKSNIFVDIKLLERNIKLIELNLKRKNLTTTHSEDNHV